MLFLSRYPLHLDRNTYVASGFFSAMFLAMARSNYWTAFLKTCTWSMPITRRSLLLRSALLAGE